MGYAPLRPECIGIRHHHPGPGRRSNLSNHDAGPFGFLFQDDSFHGALSPVRKHERTVSRHQFVEEDTQLINIRGGGQFSPLNLLGGCILRRHDPLLVSCHGEGVFVNTGMEELGNTKIEQLDITRLCDQDVAGFQIPMHDQILMGIMNRCTYFLKQHKPLRQCQTMILAVRGNRTTIHIFHDEIGLALFRGTAIE